MLYPLSPSTRPRPGQPILLIFLVLLSLAGLWSVWPTTDQAIMPPGRTIPFIPNAGQSDPAVQIQSHSGGQTIFFLRDRLLLSRPDGRLARLQFLDANPDVNISGADPLPGVVNYLTGRDPDGWHTNLFTYTTVRYENLYPGVDWEVTGRGHHH